MKKNISWTILTTVTAIFAVLIIPTLFLMKSLVFERFKGEVLWAADVALAAINPAHVAASTASLGSIDFIENSDTKRLKEELESLGNLFLPRGVDAIYLMEKKGSEIYFLAESTPFGEIGFVVPGSLYKEAPDDLYQVFNSKEGVFTDVYTDEYGTYFSQFAPVVDRDGVMVAALGVDLRYDYFQTYLLKARLIVFGVGLFIYLLVVLAIFVFRRKLDSERILTENNKQIKSIIDSIPSGLISFGTDQKVVFWNHACNGMFASTSKEAFGRPIEEFVKFKTISEQGSGREINSFSFSEADSYLNKKLEMIVDKNGQEAVIELSFSFFEVDGEKMAVALFEDISFKKQRERELEDQRYKFEKMNALMLDREIKMVELKGEIAKLKNATTKE